MSSSISGLLWTPYKSPVLLLCEWEYLQWLSYFYFTIMLGMWRHMACLFHRSSDLEDLYSSNLTERALSPHRSDLADEILVLKPEPDVKIG